MTDDPGRRSHAGRSDDMVIGERSWLTVPSDALREFRQGTSRGVSLECSSVAG